MRQNSFNIVHLAIALLCVMLIVAVILPMLGSVRGGGSRKMQNSTQLRGIHQGLVTYAHSNNQFFPGLNRQGENERITVEERFHILLEDDYFTPDYAISPSETERITEWQGWRDDHAESVTPDNYSYAMLQIPKDGGRRIEWSQTLNTHAIVLSDRNTGTKAEPSSIHVEPGDSWSGSVLWNDNHVGFESEDIFETYYGEFDPGKHELNPDDRLFESPGMDDVLMVHNGNGKD